MPSGPCGINCDLCKLKILYICSSCGPGRSQVAKAKLAAQQRLLGAPCPILACANFKQIDYCLRDCELFPCENFTSGPYPYSSSFLDMQRRRRQQPSPALTPYRSQIEIPEQFWDKIQQRRPIDLCQLLPGRLYGDQGIIFSSLNQEFLLDCRERCLKTFSGQDWEVVSQPQLELITLLYLLKADAAIPPSQELIGIADLREAHYFTGPHALPLEELLARFGSNPADWRRVAGEVGGEKVPLADEAFCFYPLPRVPVYLLLWLGDEELPPQFTVLFDRTIENFFSASGIWLLVNYVTMALLRR